jgi:periplasmic protein CpxP/Spy
MKVRIRNTAVIVLALAVFGIGFHQAYAALSDDGTLSSLNPFLKMGYSRLGLSDQQMNAIRAVVKKNLPQLQTMTNQIIAERRTLKSLIRAESVNEPAIRAQVGKLAALEADACVKRAFIGQEIRTILTPEQLKKAEVLRQYKERIIDRHIARTFKWFAED